MCKSVVSSWIRDAAAALCGRYGAVTHRARQAGCSRQTVYEHGRRLLEQVSNAAQNPERPSEPSRSQAQRTEELRQSVVVGNEQLERFAVTAQAMGVSLRQAEELLATLLPDDRVPDHSTMGRWTENAGRRATEVLAMLDPLCTSTVTTLCVDEIFFGG